MGWVDSQIPWLVWAVRGSGASAIGRLFFRLQAGSPSHPPPNRLAQCGTSQPVVLSPSLASWIAPANDLQDGGTPAKGPAGP